MTRRVAFILAGLAAALTFPAGDIASAQESCSRLQAELAGLERGGADRSIEMAYRKQQAELQRSEDRARRAGCFGGNFLFLRARPGRECRTLIPQLRQMQENLIRIDQRRRSIGDPRRAARLRTRIAALGCFGAGAAPEQRVVNRGTYRTLCVRSCDGYYFPISFAASRSQFGDDAAQCQRACGAGAELYYHPNPGSGAKDMVSLLGQPYGSLPTAFRYRESYNPSCTCQPSESRFTTIGSAFPLPQPMPAETRPGPPSLPAARPALGEDPETSANRTGGFSPAGDIVVRSAARLRRGGEVRVIGEVYGSKATSDSLLLTQLPD